MLRTTAILLLMASAFSHAGRAQAGGAADLARSVFLGQAYPSGHVYLEAFGDLGNHREGLTAWPEEILLLPLDSGASWPTAGPTTLAGARYVRSAAWVNPPEVEGMLGVDSPCVSEGYHVRAGGRYLPREPTGHPGHTEDYFGTIDWYGCGGEPSVPIYHADIPLAVSFGVLALPLYIDVVAIDHSVRGDARPLTASEADEVASQRARDEQCTLEPHYLDGAKQIVQIATRNPAHILRLSSHISACTSLAEVFVLDIMDGDHVITTLRTSRWRGNP